MTFELYAERPLAESIAVETVAAAVGATVACGCARALIDKETRELSPVRTLIVAGAAMAASWIAASAVRTAAVRRSS